MSTTPIGSRSAKLDDLVQQIVDRVDGNDDGQISRAEFGDFLTRLVTAFRPTGPSTTSPMAIAASGLHAVDANENDFPPSMWTDDNAPYGVTFAGFSPQHHQHLTLGDLGIPGKAEKYAVYHYLVTNKIQPTSDWAPAAAEALNRKYNTNVYRAIDGETLGYGYEYVHSAPNGYSMLPGTYNPHATGEFFWGTTEA
jgi:hypothetical protein